MGVQVESTARRIGTVLGAALIAGVVAGIASRILMGTLAVAMGDVINFSVPGTLAILVLYAVVAIPAAATARASAAARRAGRWVSTGLLAIASARNGITDAKTIVFASDDRLWLIAVIIAGMAATLVAYGMLAQYLARRLARASREAAPGASGASVPQLTGRNG